MTTSPMRIFRYSQQGGNVYRFRGASGPMSWPLQRTPLAAGGLWNFLWRLGLRAAEPVAISANAVATGASVFISIEGPLPADLAQALLARREGREWTIVTGTVEAVASLLPVREVPLTWSDGIGVSVDDGAVGLLAPPKSQVFALDAPGGWTTIGELFAVGGERQTPDRAILQKLERTPLAVVSGRLVIINADPFAAYQAWLQGHDDLGPWLGWRHRMVWLDEYAVFLADLLDRIAPGLLTAIPPCEINLADRVMVLRHDLDHSRDTSLLDYEVAAGVPATHAILDDRNLKFWMERLARHPDHEAAFHYDTARVPTLIDRLMSRTGIRTPIPIAADPSRIAAGGLARQIGRIVAKGLRPRTLHRHLSFLYYPEWIDALFATDQSVVGGSSYFRGRVLRFGAAADNPNGGAGVETPDVQFPTWFPFRPWHAAIGHLAAGFEGSCIMEAEPELVMQVLAQALRRPIRRVVTLCYHPAHARTNIIVTGGTTRWFNRTLCDTLAAGWSFQTLAAVFDRCRAACR